MEGKETEMKEPPSAPTANQVGLLRALAVKRANMVAFNDIYVQVRDTCYQYIY